MLVQLEYLNMHTYNTKLGLTLLHWDLLRNWMKLRIASLHLLQCNIPWVILRQRAMLLSMDRVLIFNDPEACYGSVTIRLCMDCD